MKIISLTDDYFWKRDLDTYATHFTLPPAKQIPSYHCADSSKKHNFFFALENLFAVFI